LKERFLSAVFISYRRKDSEQFSARLHEGLDKKLGQEEVFLDVENIDVAADWKLRLQTAINAASLVIVVIGPLWMEEIQKRAIQRSGCLGNKNGYRAGEDYCATADQRCRHARSAGFAGRNLSAESI
jgi:hypothetical protein